VPRRLWDDFDPGDLTLWEAVQARDTSMEAWRSSPQGIIVTQRAGFLTSIEPAFVAALMGHGSRYTDQTH
jgi:hypothetical protein